MVPMCVPGVPEHGVVLAAAAGVGPEVPHQVCQRLRPGQLPAPLLRNVPAWKELEVPALAIANLFWSNKRRAQFKQPIEEELVHLQPMRKNACK